MVPLPSLLSCLTRHRTAKNRRSGTRSIARRYTAQANDSALPDVLQLGRERDVKREEAIEKWKDQKKEVLCLSTYLFRVCDFNSRIPYGSPGRVSLSLYAFLLFLCDVYALIH